MKERHFPAVGREHVESQFGILRMGVIGVAGGGNMLIDQPQVDLKLGIDARIQVRPLLFHDGIELLDGLQILLLRQLNRLQRVRQAIFARTAGLGIGLSRDQSFSGTIVPDDEEGAGHRDCDQEQSRNGLPRPG